MLKSRYVLIDNILYHLAVDNSLRIVLPKENRLAVIKKVHKGSTQRKICMTPEGCKNSQSVEQSILVVKNA